MGRKVPDQRYNEAMANEPVFSEQEASKIIQRAVELSEQQSTGKYQSGVTRTELEKIASEVGVSVDVLDKAIRESVEGTQAKGGFRFSEEFERVVEGELDPGQYDLVIEGLKPMANHGQPLASQVGRTLSLSTWTGVGQAKVDLTSRNGRTKVKVKSNSIFQFLMTLHPALITALVATGALGEKGMVWLGAGIGAAALAVGASLFGFLTKKGHKKAEALANDMRDRIANTLEAEQNTKSVSLDQSEELHQRVGQS